MATVMEANQKAKAARLKQAEYEAIWESRKIWARAHVWPVMKGFLNEAMLKENFGEIGVYVGDKPAEGCEVNSSCKGLGTSGHGPLDGLGFLPATLCARTVLINPGVSDNYMFMCGVIGSVSGDYWMSQYMPEVPSFSLAFAATHYITPSRHSSFTPRNIKTVGLPEKNDDAFRWIRKQIRVHWEYWLEHNSKRPERNGVNDYYGGSKSKQEDQYQFRFPKEL